MYNTRTRRNRKYPVNSVCPTATEVVRQKFEELTKRIDPDYTNAKGYGLPLSRIRVYAVDQLRGRAYWNKNGYRVITIPLWAMKKGETYFEWYVAHEMSHHYAHLHDHGLGHGPEFMKWLKRVCPARSIHHELGYKPRNAAAAGIRKPAV